MKFEKLMEKLGLSWHDVFIIIAVLETSWWSMYAFVDGADVVLRLQEDPVEYHPFLIFEKCVSCVKLFLSLACIWYGTIVRGQSLALRVYVISGSLIDTCLILSWVLISIEESWPLDPSNTFGLHYIVTFVAYRTVVYVTLYKFMNEIFVTPFGRSSAVGAVNGTTVVVGIPDQRTSVHNGDNLVFLGKGVCSVIEYYRVEPERACLIAFSWDVLWNMSIIVSQEIPELAFNVIFIGIFGSLPLHIPTENLGFRFVRVLLGLVGMLLVIRKTATHIKLWIASYLTLLFANTIFFCFTASSVLEDETFTAVFILCSVFFSSIAAKLLVTYLAMRFYAHIKSANTMLVNDSMNEC